MKYVRSRNNEEGKSRQLKTKPLVLLIAILLVCNMLWFIAWLIPNNSWKTNEEVASVDGKPITREAWMVAMEKEIGRDTLLNLVNNKVMEAAAKKYGITASEKEVNLELALIQSVGGETYAGLDEEKMRQEIRSALILEKVLTKDVVIEEDAIKQYYEENESLFNIAPAYRTAIIVVNSKEEAEQTLRELSDGSSFGVLAKERSIDPASANLDGDIGYINESVENIDEAIVKTVLKMKKNTTSDVVSLQNGTYAVIHVSDTIDGQAFTLKEVKDHIKRGLALEQFPELVSPEEFWQEFDTKWFYGE